MYVFFRFLYTYLYTRFVQGPASIFTESSITYRVWPNDLDFNFHMNNGRYLTLMDLGRFQLLQRAGFIGYVVRGEWMPVLGGAQIRFRRSLSPFQTFELRTKLYSWDEKWIYMEQSFHSRGEMIATAMVRGQLRDKNGNIPMTRLMEMAGEMHPPPNPPPLMPL